jgi:hypothetical protein
MSSQEKEFLLACIQAVWSEGESPDLLGTKMRKEGLDWNEIIRLAAQNRVDSLLHRLLVEEGLDVLLPSACRERLDQAFQRRYLRTTLLMEEVRRILQAFYEAGIPCIALRGSALVNRIYPEASLRPAADLDLLLLPKDLQPAKQLLSQMGYAKPVSALPDRYYERNHLHLRYVNSSRRIPVEIHWALDHKYTLLTIDYAGIFRRAQPAAVAGSDGLMMSSEDLLLTLCIHLAKHCPHLQAAWQSGRLQDYMLDQGALLWLCDIAGVLDRLPEELDWKQVHRRAQDWGACEALGISLRASNQLLRSPLPSELLAPPTVTRWQRWLFRRLVGAPGSTPTRSIHGLNSRLFFRPIRLLDVTSYLFPNRDYIVRRYGSARGMNLLINRGKHLAGALAQGFSNLMDVFRYSLSTG